MHLEIKFDVLKMNNLKSSQLKTIKLKLTANDPQNN